jgi:hypothetical protein
LKDDNKETELTEVLKKRKQIENLKKELVQKEQELMQKNNQINNFNNTISSLQNQVNNLKSLEDRKHPLISLIHFIEENDKSIWNDENVFHQKARNSNTYRNGSQPFKNFFERLVGVNLFANIRGLDGDGSYLDYISDLKGINQIDLYYAVSDNYNGTNSYDCKIDGRKRSWNEIKNALTTKNTKPQGLTAISINLRDVRWTYSGKRGDASIRESVKWFLTNTNFSRFTNLKWFNFSFTVLFKKEGKFGDLNELDSYYLTDYQIKSEGTYHFYLPNGNKIPLTFSIDKNYYSYSTHFMKLVWVATWRNEN